MVLATSDSIDLTLDFASDASVTAYLRPLGTSTAYPSITNMGLLTARAPKLKCVACATMVYTGLCPVSSSSTSSSTFLT